ncbi:MAG: hypothetical protein E7510_10340 [Ruminococcus sp.]|nr:hypothetical protein [Ruminococcus sp.]
MFVILLKGAVKKTPLKYKGHLEADITRLVDENGDLAEKYYYDEWGVETETLRYGDITGDGEENINDYTLLKRHLFFNSSELTAEQQLASNLNGDGKTDADDLNILKQILFGDLKNCPADTNKDGFINEKNNIKYAGYIYDGETGLYYLNARFYDPQIARFIQEVAASIAIGGKIGGKIPTGKVSVLKVSALSKIRNAIDNFGTPALAGANGMVISGAVPIEASISSTAVASA